MVLVHRSRARVVAACLTLLSVVVVVATFLAYHHTSGLVHSSHAVGAQGNVWVEYLRGAALGALPPCSFLILPTLLKNDTDTLVVLWEVNECDGTQLVQWLPSGVKERKPDLEPLSALATVRQLGEGRFVCQAVVKDLKPGYYDYRVVMRAPLQHFGGASSTRAASEWTEFHHLGAYDASAKPPQQGSTDLRLAVIGDSQSGARTFRHHLLHVSGRSPDMLLHLGDGVQDYYVPREWHAYLFGPLETANLGQKVPLVYVRGNHDGPSSGPVSAYTAGTHYATTVGPVRIIVLDSEADSAEQYKFLQAELEYARLRPELWVVVGVHIPPYVEYWERKAWERGEKDWGAFVRNDYVPLFERYHVDLVISGHSHIYQSGQQNGVRYLVVGGGGGALESEQVTDWNVYTVTRIAHHYGVLHASECSLAWSAFDQDDRLFDSFYVAKHGRSGCGTEK